MAGACLFTLPLRPITLEEADMKSKKNRIVFLSSLLVLFILISGCGRPIKNVDPKQVLFLQNNIHTQEHTNTGEYRASYANWTDPGKGHVIIPVNTLVTVDRFKSGFALILQSTQKSILFEVNEKNAGMSTEEYVRLIISPQAVELDRFSEIDRKGIQEGKAYVGMTKEGVRIALGYPARHKTPSLENNTWYFWTNRFRAFPVEFDENGMVKSVGN
jgi:hypothetical protein